ncbi:MerR family transcriptional regulator [Rheinheimera riviphila]|uniref:MerR family transcriptional regulator n=1 Tax=Rheinheimera riviphila TaxID=1834037 RepID=A0A437QC63_9GAMM|nr:MerR family transcriptional regulator [Rheinheimera riviphila]RVU31999.1 MerR family transcriptional regulator [Rheinheimera riviphila]
MFIGELSKLTGATPRAIRLYETLKLLQVRRHGQYRVYDKSHVEFVQLIKEAQSLGVSLAEMQHLKRGAQDLDWVALDQLLALKQAAVAQQIIQQQAELQRIKHYQQLIAACVAKGLNQCEPNS